MIAVPPITPRGFLRDSSSFVNDTDAGWREASAAEHFNFGWGGREYISCFVAPAHPNALGDQPG